MLIPFGEILKKYNIESKGIIHVGAHHCEEHDDYISYGIKSFVYIEPCKKSFDTMFSIIGKKYPIDRCIGGFTINETGITLVEHDIKMFNCACGSVESKMVMYASKDNEGQSNSLLEPNLHLQQHPEIIFDEAEVVNVTLLDKLPIEKEKYNILAMDVQGYEGEVLKGATETLKHIDFIYTEVNRDSTYRGNMLIDEMDEYLKDFTRVETYWPSPKWSWGDACFISKSLV